MTGTLGGALEVRGIPSYPDKLWSEVQGEIENIDGHLVITTIRVKYHVKVPSDKLDAAQRALEHHVSRCPAALSVQRGITIEWSSQIEEEREL